MHRYSHCTLAQNSYEPTPVLGSNRREGDAYIIKEPGARGKLKQHLIDLLQQFKRRYWLGDRSRGKSLSVIDLYGFTSIYNNLLAVPRPESCGCIAKEPSILSIYYLMCFQSMEGVTALWLAASADGFVARLGGGGGGGFCVMMAVAALLYSSSSDELGEEDRECEAES